MSATPKVFISYSHDSDAHRDWVYQMACRLVESGVETVLDQWDLQLGSNLIHFMENGLTNSDRVLVVCTDNYNTKSNGGLGGVGYEKNILTTELFANQDTAKFIPCIRAVTTLLKTPICLGGRTYIDFSTNAAFEQSFKSLLHELFGVPERPKPKLGKNPFHAPEEDDLPSIRGQDSTVFFSNRFSDAFPGVRGIEHFRDPTVAVDRLRLFFAEPFYFRDARPLWWWRTGDMHIDNFSVLAPDTVLIDHQELVIQELIAVNAGSYYQSFIYLRTRPSEPSGLNGPSNIADQVADWGYAREEFALFRGRPVTRSEYDDGSAVIDGQVTDLNGEATIRVKYLTPYNILIAPQGSPINNNQFDRVRVDLLNRVLAGTSTIEELTAAVLQLPKRERI